MKAKGPVAAKGVTDKRGLSLFGPKPPTPKMLRAFGQGGLLGKLKVKYGSTGHRQLTMVMIEFQMGIHQLIIAKTRPVHPKGVHLRTCIFLCVTYLSSLHSNIHPLTLSDFIITIFIIIHYLFGLNNE